MLALVVSVALNAQPTAAGADATVSDAQATRTLRIVKVTDAPEHPGGTFGGSVSMGVGPYTITLAPNALTSDPIEFSIGTGAYGVAELAWPLGWTHVGYHILGDPEGTATCDPYGSYGALNLIPEGTEDVLFCIKNSYSSGPGTRQLRLGVIATDSEHPAADFTIQLSTGAEIQLELAQDETAVYDQIEISTGSIGAQMVTPPNWRNWRTVSVLDPDGDRACSLEIPGFSLTAPPGEMAQTGLLPAVLPGDGRWLVCFQATYYPPGAPTPVRIGVFSPKTNHPGGSFQFLVGGEVVVVELQPGAAVASVDFESPQERIAVEFRQPWPQKWSPRQFWAIESRELLDCSEPLPGRGDPGTGIVLDLGPAPTTFCFQLAFVPFRMFAPLVAAD